MHRRGGKRIRMDDPPPEYLNPMTPATPMTEHGGQSVHEPDNFNMNYSGFNAGAVANSTAAEAPREEPDEALGEDDDPRSPSPAPTKRVTRSRGRGGDGGYVGRLAESPPPPPVRRRGRGGRGRGRGRGAAPPPAYSPPPVLLPGDDENSLYNILRFNKAAINQVVDLWIEQYKTNRECALVQLMQFFINSSGCRGKVEPDMAQMDHTLIIKKMTQEFDEESGEYPLIMAGQTWKKFRSSFCEFIQTLVKMCQYSIIYDQYLMDNIISLLTGLSDSQVRAFRHTATLAVMKLMTALVDVALLTSVNCDNCLRQYEAERLKARDKRASERLEVLVAKRQELEENMEEIKNMLSYMFKSVFVHRYRDTLADIRAITMSEIGTWMEKFPSHFLDDLYLKYIGWTLHDKVGEVRLRCLQALQPLYECDDLRGKLELFTSKFKDRIVSMSLDKETEVAVRAVRLVISILKMHPDVLTDKDCENVYELVYSSQRAVAAAAGEFLNVRLFRLEAAAARSPPRSRRGKARLPSTPLIRDLVQFFIESELHEHGAYLVDSLIDSNPMMKDWEAMTDLLLEEAGPGEEPLDNRQESSLIELMVCCVRQASTGEPPVGRGASRKHQPLLTKDQAKAVSDDRAKMTVHFMNTLPQLLEKFGADPEKLINLLSIPQHFELELFTTHRQEGNLTLLLNKLRDIVSVQTEAEVLETCGRTLDCLCGPPGGAFTRCNVARATITDMCVNRYKEAIDDYRSLIEGGEEPDADETFNVINSLRKVSVMYMCHNLNDTNIWDSLFEDLPKCTKQTDMPSEALVYVIRSLFYCVLWSLHEAEERAAPSDAAVATLRERLLAYTAHCTDIIANGTTRPIKEEAYTSVCDLLVYFSEPLALAQHRGEPQLAALTFAPDEPLCDLLNTFIQEFVFVHHNYDGQDERRIEELHKRRNFLAAYCKLIVYNIAPIRRAADVFKHYIKCYNDYGDIIKFTLSKAREMNKLNCALTMQLAMQALYSDMMSKVSAATPGAVVTRHTPELHELKELAKRFAVMFGLDALKNREAVTALHRAGVAFAAVDSALNPPPRLAFLEPLSEFSNKLLRTDKRALLKFVDAKLPLGNVQWGDEWQPLSTYRGSLLCDSPDERPPQPKRHYVRKQRGPVDEEDAEDNADSDGELAGVAVTRLRPQLRVLRRDASLPTRRRRHPRTPSPASSASPDIQSSSSPSRPSDRITPRATRNKRQKQQAPSPPFERNKGESDSNAFKRSRNTSGDSSDRDCEVMAIQVTPKTKNSKLRTGKTNDNIWKSVDESEAVALQRNRRILGRVSNSSRNTIDISERSPNIVSEVEATEQRKIFQIEKERKQAIVQLDNEVKRSLIRAKAGPSSRITRIESMDIVSERSDSVEDLDDAKEKSDCDESMSSENIPIAQLAAKVPVARDEEDQLTLKLRSRSNTRESERSSDSNHTSKTKPKRSADTDILADTADRGELYKRPARDYRLLQSGNRSKTDTDSGDASESKQQKSLDKHIRNTAFITTRRRKPSERVRDSFEIAFDEDNKGQSQDFGRHGEVICMSQEDRGSGAESTGSNRDADVLEHQRYPVTLNLNINPQCNANSDDGIEVRDIQSSSKVTFARGDFIRQAVDESLDAKIKNNEHKDIGSSSNEADNDEDLMRQLNESIDNYITVPAIPQIIDATETAVNTPQNSTNKNLVKRTNSTRDSSGVINISTSNDERSACQADGSEDFKQKSTDRIAIEPTFVTTRRRKPQEDVRDSFEMAIISERQRLSRFVGRNSMSQPDEQINTRMAEREEASVRRSSLDEGQGSADDYSNNPQHIAYKPAFASKHSDKTNNFSDNDFAIPTIPKKVPNSGTNANSERSRNTPRRSSGVIYILSDESSSKADDESRYSSESPRSESNFVTTRHRQPREELQNSLGLAGNERGIRSSARFGDMMCWSREGDGSSRRDDSDHGSDGGSDKSGNSPE